MTAFPTRRFILTSLVLATFASMASFAIGHRETPKRAWVAGHAIPCASLGPEFCNAQTVTVRGAD